MVSTPLGTKSFRSLVSLLGFEQKKDKTLPPSDKIGSSSSAVGGRVRELVTRLTAKSYTPPQNSGAFLLHLVDKRVDSFL